MNKKNIVIFGSGGHGWFPLFELLKDDHFDFTSLMLPVDWGGSTGVIGRLLELNDCKLNVTLHGQKDFPILPWGDFNKFVMAYMSNENKAVLNFRSDQFTELWDRFVILSTNLKIDKDIIIRFRNYLKIYLEYLNDFKHLLSFDSPTCLGNLWNQFLFYSFDGGMIDFYKYKKVFLDNINHRFVTRQRLILIGKSLERKNSVVGEDMIDIHREAIFPDSLAAVDKSFNRFKPDREILSILEKADYLIIPNGSISNWLPLINIDSIVEILKEKSKSGKLFWMVNLFKTKNEFNAGMYYKYMLHKGIKPIALGPKSNIDLTYQMEIDYFKQSKEVNSLFFTNKVFGLIDENNYTSIEGLKHNPVKVYEYFKKILK